MIEDFLHYLWKHKKIDVLNLKTTANETIEIVSAGEHNLNSGPDFFNAQLKIGNQLWAGNLEIHIKSSDWFLHNHETDKAYDNVILHVVWEHDTEVFRKNNTQIPTLELKNVVSKEILDNYHRLFNKKQKWINCENDFRNTDDFTINNWLERLYFERLERKSEDIEMLLKKYSNDWEAVLFIQLAKNFGLKVNGEAFLSLAKSIDFSVIRKMQSKLENLEALLFGQASLLESDVQDAYFLTLKKEYEFLKHKFKLSTQGVLPIQFFRLRPPNFPTIRLAQLASLYFKYQNLFSKIMSAKTKEAYYNLFSVSASEFWDTHYTFSTQSKRSKKKITKAFIDLLLINTILPLKFSYEKHLGKTNVDDIILLSEAIKSEKNNIIDSFNRLKKVSTSSLTSQALIQLKNNYCDKNKCLQCAIGNVLINRG